MDLPPDELFKLKPASPIGLRLWLDIASLAEIRVILNELPSRRPPNIQNALRGH
jgi:hypothetical protein